MAATDARSGALPKVVVCICTFRRPSGVRSLLASLDALEFPGAAPDLSIVLVDNDPAQPAFESPEAAQAAVRWPLRYAFEAERGLVAARNRTLDCVATDARVALFVDDDETVSPGWAQALLDVWRGTGAQVVQGTMVPRYEVPPPPWIEELGIFRLGPFPDRQPLGFAATGNALVDLDFVRRHGLRFDPAFDLSGGEDEEFFGRVRDAGGQIVASAQAVAFDEVPAARLTSDWVLRRSRRRGNTLARIALKQRRGQVARLAKGLAAVVAGAARAGTVGLLRPADAVAGRMEMARGLGMLEAFARVTRLEYGPLEVQADRGAGS